MGLIHSKAKQRWKLFDSVGNNWKGN